MVLHEYADGTKEERPDFVYRQMEYEFRKGWILLDRLADIVIGNVRGCIVEIGMGESTPILAEIAEDAGIRLYSCDLRIKCERLYDRHVVFIGSSADFMKKFDDKPALVLLDGCHNYNVAKEEFDFFFERLTDYGVIFIHDTLPPDERLLKSNGCSDVYRLRQELEKRYEEMDCFTWPYTAIDCGLTMVIKKPKERFYWRQ